ncbi:hypothetical protein B0H14DRAFT_3437386 [Mycena olivaceomarginata]|nr:hypothetical protein B0H14DRAFT_3437386 [Mycena olivaceomarginata]
MDLRAARRAQVRALVPAVLDFDSPAPPLALSLRTSSSSLQRKKSTQSASRARLPLTELKKRAAALIVQRRRHPATTTQLSCHAIWMEAVAATRFSRLTSFLRRSTSAVSQFSRATPSPVPLPWPFLILACIPASVRIALRIRLLVRRRTCTSEERLGFVLAADAPFPYDGAGSDLPSVCSAAEKDGTEDQYAKDGGRGGDSTQASIRRGRETYALTIRVVMCRRSNRTKSQIGRSRSPPFCLPPRRRRSTHRAHQRRSLALALPRPRRPSLCPRSLLPPPSPAPHPAYIPHRDLAQGSVPPSSSLAPELTAPTPASTERDD